jgi:hypothetical protein
MEVRLGWAQLPPGQQLVAAAPRACAEALLLLLKEYLI